MRVLLYFCLVFTGFSLSAGGLKDYIHDTFEDFPREKCKYKKLYSSRLVEGFTTSPLKHTLEMRRIAEKEGRIFKNPNPFELPPGEYTFVILNSGTYYFGKKDISTAEIGIKHFQLADREKVVVAGEYSQGKFNLESGTYSLTQVQRDPQYEAKIAKTIALVFKEITGRQLFFTKEKLITQFEVIPFQLLYAYCAHPEFYEAHKKTICKDFSGCHQELRHAQP